MNATVTDASNNFLVSVQENISLFAVEVAENSQTINISIENPEGDPANVVSTDLLDVVNVQIEENINEIEINTQEVVEQVSVSVSEIAINDHGQSTGLQGGAIGEHYHLNQEDYTEAVSFLDGGASTHTQLDTEKGLSQNHRGETSIHFTNESVSHNSRNDLQGGALDEYYHLTSAENSEAVAFLNGGNITHTGVDDHVSDVTNPHEVTSNQILPSQTGNEGKVLTTNGNNVSWEEPTGGGEGIEYDKRELVVTAGLITGVVYKLLGATVDTMTITYDSSDRPLQYSYSSGKVVNLTHLGTGFLSEAL